MISRGTGRTRDQPLYDRLWGSGFLPTALSGREVPLGRRSGALPFESRRASTPAARRAMLDDLGQLNQIN